MWVIYLTMTTTHCTNLYVGFGSCADLRNRGHKGSLTVRRSEERRVGKECRSRCDWSSDVCSSDLIYLTMTTTHCTNLYVGFGSCADLRNRGHKGSLTVR